MNTVCAVDSGAGGFEINIHSFNEFAACDVDSAKNSLFTVQERVDLLSAALKKEIRSRSVSVDTFSGLLVDYCRRRRAVAVARGLRALSDFEYEFQMALMNRHLAPKLETVFLMPDEKYTYLSSTLLKEIVRLGGDVGRFVPAALVPKIRQKLAGRG
jgi:pantetheine-phosphate adenylyltransferase